MSTEPLLPSYASVARQQQHQCPPLHDAVDRGITISATPLIQALSAIIFTCNTIITTLWAVQSNSVPISIPPPSSPLLPYFALLCLVLSTFVWLGYLVFILHDIAGGPRVQRKVIIWISVAGKLVFAVTHAGIWLGYKHFYGESTQPNWLLAFLAAQAWWDSLLVAAYSYLRSQGN